MNYGIDENKLLPIPCAVDNDYFKGQDIYYKIRLKNIKKELSIDEDDFIIVWCGEIYPKRPLDLLKSLKLLIILKSLSFLLVMARQKNANHFLKK